MGYPNNDPDYYYRNSDRVSSDTGAAGTARKDSTGTSNQTRQNTGGGGGGYGGGGYGGGGIRRPSGLEYFRPGRFSPANLQQQAARRANMWLREQNQTNAFARNQARAQYKNAIIELQNARNQSRGAAIQDSANDRGRLNNMMMARDMGYGGAAAASMGNLMQARESALAGIENQYQTGHRESMNDYMATLANMTEADRAARANRAAYYDDLYEQLYGSAYDRYMAQQGLLLDAMNQRNQTRSIGY